MGVHEHKRLKHEELGKVGNIFKVRLKTKDINIVHFQNLLIAQEIHKATTNFVLLERHFSVATYTSKQ